MPGTADPGLQGRLTRPRAFPFRDANGCQPCATGELADITDRVRGCLRQTSLGVIQIGADLQRAKALLEHGNFGPWLDREFGLGRRSASSSCPRPRFGAKSEIVSYLPAGEVLELSAPSVPDELVDRVIAGEVAALRAAIRREKATERTDDRSYTVGGTFIDYLMRFKGNSARTSPPTTIRA